MGKVFTALNKTVDDGTAVRLSSEENDGGQKLNGVGSDVEPSSQKSEDDVGSLNIEPRATDIVRGMEQWAERLSLSCDPSSPAAESFRRLRSKIIHPPSGKPLKKVMIVSASPGAGKSFVCANLGFSIAQGLEQHALLIDCDLRRPSLASLFGIVNDRGLSGYLQGGADIGPLIQKTGMRKLSIIPSGPQTVNPAELLGSKKVEQLFEELNERYDDRFIIIDSPPLQAASETAVLVQHVDAVIPVVRWGAGSRSLIKQQLDALDSEKILGIIFNDYQSNYLSSKLSGYDVYDTYSSSY